VSRGPRVPSTYGAAIGKAAAEIAVPVLYLDLDGTVRWGKDELGRFVNTPDDVRIFDGVPDLLARYKEHGWRIVACSNQGGIALGLVSMDDVMAGMVETQKQSGNAFDKIIWCRHHPDADDPEMAVCWCRKPRAGMVIEVANDLAADSRTRMLKERTPPERYPPYMGLFVGDRPEDRGCAEAANVPFMEAQEWRDGGHEPAR
jgi:D-glycero-D-manno-heptose 1,7-bisphosphate phosphatase